MSRVHGCCVPQKENRVIVSEDKDQVSLKTPRKGLKEISANLQSENSIKEVNLKDQNKELIDVTLSLSQSRKEVVDLQGRLDQALSKMKIKDEAICSLNEVCEGLEKMCRSTMKKVDSLQKALASEKAQLNETEDFAHRHREELDDCKLLLASATEHAKQRGKVIKTLEVKIQTTTEHANSYEVYMQGAHDRIQDQADLINSLQTELREAEARGQSANRLEKELKELREWIRLKKQEGFQLEEGEVV
mmetsp:Transcript_13266/g.22841  ORF Transcript_13266/g.22841 Transcript_13266/m.22841 type:complete len:247 (+) Transcript_13266:50-790(+)|eukprot:CAMPEP_0196667968 /NCGR_PEP_ID=MMETSP1086-20130531/65369_1 /TAXON_ID=77921 /ORGANISM="Cyanoptyche  gloeocystis , Strain SAG4.97" /LENGTH=246 /DNA_ID=CAMNT_0042005341 /DNA_START=45 /DNA_END=785 /DNA_ORIENTATION=+